MINVAKFLKSVFLFNTLEDAELNLIEKFTLVKSLKPGEILFAEGEAANAFFVVVSGRLKVTKTSDQGNEQILHLQTVGDLIAEAAIFDIETYPASCLALEESCLIKIDSQGLKNLISSSPKLSLKILTAYSRRLRQLTKLVKELSLHDIKYRLAMYLLENSLNHDGHLTCHLAISKKELASLLGTIPETLSRTLKSLQQNKIIEVSAQGKKIIILEPSQLNPEK